MLTPDPVHPAYEGREAGPGFPTSHERISDPPPAEVLLRAVLASQMLLQFEGRAVDPVYRRESRGQHQTGEEGRPASGLNSSLKMSGVFGQRLGLK